MELLKVHLVYFVFIKGILLDEAGGVNRAQEPVMPAGYQPPKIVVSSWNRKVRHV